VFRDRISLFIYNFSFVQQLEMNAGKGGFEEIVRCSLRVKQRKVLLSTGTSLGICSASHWYQVSRVDLLRACPRMNYFLRPFGGSLQLALVELFPEYNWNLRLFPQATNFYWNAESHRRQYIEWLEDELGITNPQQWYRVKILDVVERGGSRFLSYYGNSLQKALSGMIPEYDWKPWLFERLPSGFWDSVEHRRNFLRWLSLELDIVENEDWYHVTINDVWNRGGRGFLACYDNSLQRALGSLYPEYPWRAWHFKRTTTGFWKELWDDSGNRYHYLSWLTNQLNILHLTDWHMISYTQLHTTLGGCSLLKQTGSLLSFLQRFYPFYQWSEMRFSRGTHWGKSQSYILHLVRQVLPPGASIYQNFKHPYLRFDHSRKPMELDLFIPEYSLAIEYQGEHHLQYGHFPCRDHSNSIEIQTRDNEKSCACIVYGITLISFSFWWDWKLSSLTSLIYRTRPDLQIATFESLPMNALERNKLIISSLLFIDSSHLLPVPIRWGHLIASESLIKSNF